MAGSEHLVRERAQRRIGAPRRVEQLPQLHGDNEQNGEQPRDHARQAERDIPDRLGGGTYRGPNRGTVRGLDEGRAGVRLAHAQVECRVASMCQNRTRDEHRRGHRERHGARLDTEGRHRGCKPTANGKRHKKSAYDRCPARRGHDPRVRLLTASQTASIASMCTVERGTPGSESSNSPGMSPRSSGAVATVPDERRRDGRPARPSLRNSERTPRRDRLGALAQSANKGPLDEHTSRLVKLGIAIGAMAEGAVRSNARRALQAGATPEELLHVVALTVTTRGFPAAVASYAWIEDVRPASRRAGRHTATKRRAVLTPRNSDRRDTPPNDRLVRSFSRASTSASTTTRLG